jgi:hypothetical protein
MPRTEQALTDWWEISRKQIHKSLHKGFNTLFVLVYQSLWKERNARVFDIVSSSPARLSNLIKEEGLQWVMAGFSVLADILR